MEEILKDNPIAHLNAGALLLLLFLGVFSGALFAYIFKNRYDPKKLIICYFGYALIHFALGIFVFHVPIIITIGTYLVGGVVALIRSNHYFYN